MLRNLVGYLVSSSAVLKLMPLRTSGTVSTFGQGLWDSFRANRAVVGKKEQEIYDLTFYLLARSMNAFRTSDVRD